VSTYPKHNQPEPQQQKPQQQKPQQYQQYEPRLFSSESVSAGHPDKMADQISDAILDELLRQDPYSRVACETLLKSDLVVVAGEISSQATIDVENIVRQTILDIGYDDSKYGIDGRKCRVIQAIDQQSADIAIGINEGEGIFSDQGAGDQGLMFGFACDETPQLMPAPIYYAHKLLKKLRQAYEQRQVPWLRADAKSQVTINYSPDHSVLSVPCVVLSTQHDPGIKHQEIQDFVIEEIIKKTIPHDYLKKCSYLINPTGQFVVGGPLGDTGLTGRKIIVDTYGGQGGHGGGAFSGKDPTKVDRSAAYMVRYIAKNMVASGIVKRCLIQVAYAIGVPEPVSIWIDDYGTAKCPPRELKEIVLQHFSLKPKDIIEHLQLRRPIYQKTATYGHFGQEGFPWEETNKTSCFH